MTTCPNIVLITIDCLRADHMSCYGYEGATTPHLDRLAAQGTLFLQAVAQGPGTTFAFPAIMGSVYPSMVGQSGFASATQPLLAEKLQAGGYATAAFVSNPYLGAAFGYHRGFEVFEELQAPTRLSRRLQRAVNRALNPLGLGLQCPPYPSAAAITERACAWLEEASTPFFLWLHYMDAHWPYNLQRCEIVGPWRQDRRVLASDFVRVLRKAPDRVTEADIVALETAYDAGIRYVDGYVGHLVAKLEAQQLANRTWIVATADHGEEFGEHGGFFHTRKLYDESIRVPLLIRAPLRELVQVGVNTPVIVGSNAQLPKNLAGSDSKLPTDLRRQVLVPGPVQQQVRHLDLAPTLLDAAGLPAEEAFEGHSFLPILGQPAAASQPAISEVPTPEQWILSLRRDGWKLIAYLQLETLDVLDTELFDLEADPGEQRNVSHQQPQLVAELQEQILAGAAVIRERAEAADDGQVDVDEDVAERLRALGYLG